jgi:hypothetical protein
MPTLGAGHVNMPRWQLEYIGQSGSPLRQDILSILDILFVTNQSRQVYCIF